MTAKQPARSPSVKLTWIQRLRRVKGDAWRGWIKCDGVMHWGPTTEDPYEAHAWALKMRQTRDRTGKLPFGAYCGNGEPERPTREPGDTQQDRDPETGENIVVHFDPPRHVPDIDPVTGEKNWVVWSKSSSKDKSGKDPWPRWRDQNKHRFSNLSNPTLLIAMGAKLYKLEQLKSEGMQEWFRAQARALLKYFPSSTKLRSITREHLEAFIGQRLEDVSASTVCANLTCLSGVISRAQKCGFDLDPLKFVERPTQDPQITPWFEHEELLAIIERIRVSGDTNAARDSAMVAVFYLLGFRRSEAAGILIERDIDWGRRLLTIAKPKATVAGKKAPRTLLIPADAMPHLETLINGRSKGPLFETGKTGITNVFGKWREELPEPRLKAMALRKSCGVRLYGSADFSQANIGEYLGHDPKMCTKYHALTGAHKVAMAEALTL